MSEINNSEQISKMGTLQILNGDCLELMKTLPDKSIDLFVCDLPYGCLMTKQKENPERKTQGGLRARYVNGKDSGTVLNLQTVSACSWDVPIDLEAFWIQVKRLCKNAHTPVLMFCTAKFGYELIKSNEEWFRYDLVWKKTRAVGFLSANKMPIRSHELIYVFSKKGANYNRIDYTGDFKKAGGGRHNHEDSTGLYGKIKSGEVPNNEGKRCPTSVVEIANKMGKGNHPTQKPQDLYEWLITRYSNEGDTILDPTAGSFASCFTAQRLGRNAIGMEMDEKFYEKAKGIAGV
jgi:site-specific DNA-methyltransferase (adenine-specific)